MRSSITTSLTRASKRPAGAGFTLLEMLVVLVIIALIAGLALPAIRGNLEGRAMNAAGNQFLSDLSWARQKAISQRSTVAIVFVTDKIKDLTSPIPEELQELRRLQAGIYTHYALYSFRRAGEQPGRGNRGYITEWRSLPEKTFFSTNFLSVDVARTPGITNILADLSSTADFPFPFSESSDQIMLPYIAFNDEGRMVRNLDFSTGRGEWVTDITNFVAIARGAVFYVRQPDGGVLPGTVDLQEIPPYNSTNNLFVVDPYTGKAQWVRTELP